MKNKIMIIMTTILNWFKLGVAYIKTTVGQRNILLGLTIIVLIILLVRGCGSVDETAITMLEQNNRALNDSIRTYKTRSGELVYEKSVLLADKAALKTLNKELYNDVKKLKDHVITISSVKVKIKHDTVYLTPVLESVTFNADSSIVTNTFTWSDSTIFNKDNYNFLGGKYTISSDTAMHFTTKDFVVNTNEIGMSFKTGITESNDGNLEIFIKSDYPGFTPTAIDGVLIDPRESDVIKKFFPPKRWSIGPYIGYGVYFDPQKITFGHGVQAGIAIHYAIFEWREWKIKIK